MVWYRHACALILITLLFSPVMPGRAQESSAPYYYYFNGSASSFVLAKADGTDAKVVSEGLTTESHVNWAEWSPSGEWLAWSATNFRGCGSEPAPMSAYLASGESASRLGTFDALQMVWAPDQDWLLVASVTALENDTARLEWAVTSPGRDDVLTSDQATVRAEAPINPVQLGAFWVAHTMVIYFSSGERTVFYYQDLDEHDTVSVVEVDGKLQDVSPEGYVAIADGDSLIVSSIFGSETISLPIGEERIRVDWHDNQAVVFSKEAAWWLDLSQQRWHPIYENPGQSTFYQRYPQPTWGPGDTGIVADTSGMLHVVSPRGVYPLQTRGTWHWLDAQRVAIDWSDELTVYDLVVGSQEAISGLQESSFGMPSFSPDERYIGYVEDGAVIFDRNTSTTHSFTPNPLGYAGNGGGQVLWHPEQPWLISVEEGPAGCGSTYFTSFVNIDAGTHFLVDCSQPCANWLPAGVDPSAFVPFEIQQPPAPLHVFNGFTWIEHMIWEGAWIRFEQDRMIDPDEWAGTYAWNPQTGEMVISALRTLPDEPQPVEEYVRDTLIVAKSEDGSRLLGLDGVIYDAQTEAALFSVGEEIDPSVGQFRFSPGGRYLAAVRGGDALILWDANTGERLFRGLYPSTAVFSPDETRIAVAQSWNVEVYAISELVDYHLSSRDRSVAE
jgi:hypothetical protein